MQLGLAVSRRIGGAVTRNRIKRRLRESFRCGLRTVLPTASAVVIIARDGAGQLKTQEITAELTAPLSQMADKLEATRSVGS